VTISEATYSPWDDLEIDLSLRSSGDPCSKSLWGASLGHDLALLVLDGR
jgi:hypothetical protein